MEREYVAQINGAGHLILPEAVRKRHHMRNDSRVTIEDRDSEVIIKLPNQPLPAPLLEKEREKINRERMKAAIAQSMGLLGTDTETFDAYLEAKRQEREREDRGLRSR